MASLLRGVSESYNYIIYELADPRTRDDWPGFISICTILLSYIYFVKKCGPEWMKNKQPYQLKNTILLYNVFQILICGYMFIESFFNVWVKEYSWSCEPMDHSNSPLVKKVLFLTWMYMVIKFIDLLDTVFFVLRKKNRQISTLHLYHHILMALCTWFVYKYIPTGHGDLLGVINCFVHTVMYTYYLIAGLGAHYKKYLWWKQYVTILQMVQFGIVFVHNLYPIFTDCTYPKWINVVICIFSLQFVYMFGAFYYENYIKVKTGTKNTIKLNQTKLD